MEFQIPGETETTKRPNDIVPFGRNTILVGGDFGLYLFNKISYDFTLLGENIIRNSSIFTLEPIGHQDVLAGYAGGLVRISSDVNNEVKVERVLFEEGGLAVLDQVYDISFDGNVVWIAALSGVYCASINKGKLGSFEKILSTSEGIRFTRLFASTSSGRTVDFQVSLFGFRNNTQEGGVYVLNINEDKTQLRNIGSTGIHPATKLIGKEDNLFVSTDGGGIICYDLIKGREITRLSTESKSNSLRSNSVYSLMIDNKDILWVGYYLDGADGLAPVSLNLLSTYKMPWFDSDSKFIRTFSRNGDKMMLGGRDKIWYIDEKQGETIEFSNSNFNNALPTDIVWYVDKFIIGTFGGGIYTYRPGDFTLRRIEEAGSPKVCCITVDPNGKIWVGAWDGLFVYNQDGSLYKKFDKSNSSLKNGVVRVFFDSKGRGWIATEKNLQMYDPLTETIRVDALPDNFIKDKFVRAIAEDINGDLWFAYDRNKIFWSNSSITDFHQVENDLPIDDNDINTFRNYKGKWLLGTSAGLYVTSDFKDYRKIRVGDENKRALFNPKDYYDPATEMIYFANSGGLLRGKIVRLVESITHDRNLALSSISFNGIRQPMTFLRDKKGQEEIHIPADTGSVDLFFYSKGEDSSEELEYKRSGEDSWHLIKMTGPVSLHSGNGFDGELIVRLAGDSYSERRYQLVQIGKCEAGTFIWIIAVIILVFVLFCIVRFRSTRGTQRPNLDTDYDKGPASDYEQTTMVEGDDESEKISVNDSEVIPMPEDRSMNEDVYSPKHALTPELITHPGLSPVALSDDTASRVSTLSLPTSDNDSVGHSDEFVSEKNEDFPEENSSESISKEDEKNMDLADNQSKESDAESADTKNKSKYRYLSIDNESLDILSKRLYVLMHDSKIFKDPQLKMTTLAEQLNVNSATLSYLFSQYLNTSFYRYVNTFRIKEFKRMIKDDGVAGTYTLTALSSMCGFSSRSSFFRYFKEMEGISPVDYIKGQNNNTSKVSK